jgi:hypothetical protein
LTRAGASQDLALAPDAVWTDVVNGGSAKKHVAELLHKVHQRFSFDRPDVNPEGLSRRPIASSKISLPMWCAAGYRRQIT